jgi:hypothetical protein
MERIRRPLDILSLETVSGARARKQLRRTGSYPAIIPTLPTPTPPPDGPEPA